MAGTVRIGNGRCRAESPLVEPLESRVLLAAPTDPQYHEQWGLESVEAAAAWKIARGKPGVKVAHIDTGIDYDHPDLYENIWINQAEIPRSVRRGLVDVDRDKLITFWDLNHPRNAGKVADANHDGRIDAGDLLAPWKPDGSGGWADGINGRTYGGDPYVDDIIGWDFADGDNDPMDHDGHGTHTAGIIGAMGSNRVGITGMAWKTSLMAIKVFDDDGDAASPSRFAEAIRYAVDAKAKVSNNSWGGSGSRELKDAVAYAESGGQVMVVAAGNDGLYSDFPFFGSYPAKYSYDNIVAVAALDQDQRLAYFSNSGDITVDLAAPGEDILSTYKGARYKEFSGTSMATAFVTGAVALLLSHQPKLSMSQITDRLLRGADQTEKLRGTSVTEGKLNAGNAVAGRKGDRTDDWFLFPWPF